MGQNRGEITDAVLAFVNAQTWEEKKRIVEERRDVLLTDAADEVLSDLLIQYRGDERATRIIEEHRNLLARCQNELVTDAVRAFVNAQTWSEGKRIVEERRDVLLTEAADKFLADLLIRCRDDEYAIRIIERRRELLASCRQQGIDSAFPSYLQSPAATNRGEITDAVLAFVNAQTWEEKKRIVEERRDVLLTDAADEVLSDLLIQYRGDEHNIYVLEDRQTLLRHCLREGIEAAFTDYLPSPGTPQKGEPVTDAVLAFVNAQTWNESKRIVEEYQDLLLTDAADEALAVLLTEYRGQENSISRLKEYRELLARCRQEGIGAAFTRYLVTEAVRAFVSAPSLEEGKRIVEESQDVLLTDAADEVLFERLTKYQGDENALLTVEQRRDLLARCRREGIDAAFASYLRPSAATSENELDSLLRELKNLSTPDEMPRRIVVCREALVLIDPEDHPGQWAGLQAELGRSLYQSPSENVAQNIEEAISCYDQALEVLEALPRQDSPEQRAMVLYQRMLARDGLGAAYLNRIWGDRAENLEKAIYHYKQTLEVPKETVPRLWAMARQNLGNAYKDRTRTDRAENLEKAIYYYKQALEVFSQQEYPLDRAVTQHNLALAYRDRAAQDIEEAISLREQALEVFNWQYLQLDWARTQHDQARAYRDRIREDRAENLEEAIRRYKQALKIRSKGASQLARAMTQDSLAVAYSERLQGDRAQNLEKSIFYYKQVLDVSTPDTHPQACRDTAYRLGNLLYGEGRLAEARTILKTAHEAVEALRGELVREGAKQSLAEENVVLYARLVHCCLMEGDEEAAFEYAVAGKGRAFVDMLATASFDLSAAGAEDPHLAEDLHQARELRQQIDNLLARLSGEGGTYPEEDDGEGRRSVQDQMQSELRSLKVQEAAYWEEMSFRYPALTATQQAPTLSVEEARELSEEIGATLVEYYRHAGGWCAFVVTPGGVRHVPLPGVDEIREDMLGWLREVEESPYGLNEWSYDSLRSLHQAVIAPLGDHLSWGGAVVFAPFSWLHLLPLNAALDPVTGRYAADDHLLGLTPNLAALRVALAQKAQQGASSAEKAYERLLGVAYPGTSSSNYLHNVVPEAEAAARRFAPQDTLLRNEEATPEALLSHAHGQDVIHLGCHGTFDPEAPEQSGLMLSGGTQTADPRWLTIREVITKLHLEQTRLATIGACLSGRVHLRGGEEHVGLVQAMMSAGAGTVVASLWPVHDTSTRALFGAFYAGIKAGKSPSVALGEAARTVRSQPDWEHPYYWAAFQPTGLAHEGDTTDTTPPPDEVADPVREAHQEKESIASVRGDSRMDEKQTVDKSMSLLRQMKRRLGRMRAALEDAGKREDVAKRLRDLEEQASGVQTERDLLGLADKIHRLVEDTPPLAEGLLPKEMDVEEEQRERWFSLEGSDASREDLNIQDNAVQMLNEVRAIRQEVEQPPREESS